MPTTPIPDVNWIMSSGGLAFSNDLRRHPATDPPRGIFGEFPGSTPKYALNDGPVDDFRETMARMFLQVPYFYSFLASLNDPKSKQIGKVIGGTVGKETADGTVHYKGYIDFILQAVQHSFQEKSQVVETLADDHVAYFYGQAAPTFNYSGVLINTKQDDQAMNMLRIYRDMGRGTMLAQRNTLISLRYDGLIVSGAMLNLSLSLASEMETVVPFNFSLLVKQVLLLPNIGRSGPVQLTTNFTAGGPTNVYLPFATGLTDLATTSVKVTAIPPTEIIPPTSTVDVAVNNEEEALKEDENSSAKMANATRTLSEGELETQAEEQAEIRAQKNTYIFHQ